MGGVCGPELPGPHGISLPSPDFIARRTPAMTLREVVAWVRGPGGHGSLAFLRLHHGLDLLLHLIEVEGGRVLHRRIVDRRHRQLPDVLLDLDKTPELARVEV